MPCCVPLFGSFVAVPCFFLPPPSLPRRSDGLQVLSDLQQLGFDYLDLVLLHGPNLAADNEGGCTPEACAANRAQWKAYAQLKVRVPS